MKVIAQGAVVTLEKRHDRRKIEGLAQPVLDYSALSPGEEASSYVRKVVDWQNLENRYGVTVRLTGPVALSDEEFALLGRADGVAGRIARSRAGTLPRPRAQLRRRSPKVRRLIGESGS